MLILECSPGCYGRKDGRTDDDGSVTISLHNFVGEVIITFDQDKKITGTNLFTITFV